MSSIYCRAHKLVLVMHTDSRPCKTRNTGTVHASAKARLTSAAIILANQSEQQIYVR